VAFAIQELGEQWGEKIPPLNLIVVQAGTQLPGHGADGVAHYYFDDGGAGMAANRKAYVQAAMAAVFDYGPKWDRVAQALGVDVLDAAHATRDEGNPIELPAVPTAYRPESSAYKALKASVAAHSEWFEDYGAFEAGVNEHRLSSGDSLDAYFTNGRESLAVEVKASNASDAELMRGIYQPIKYRAVLRAECIALRKLALCDAVLVSTPLLGKACRPWPSAHMWTSCVCVCRGKRRSEGTYPDLFAKLKISRLLVVEYEGGHRFGNDDNLV